MEVAGLGKRLFQMIFATALSVVLISFVVILCFVGADIGGEPTEAGTLLLPFLLVLPISLIVASLMAFFSYRIIVKPISELDLRTPSGDRIFPELRPLVDRLTHQSHELFSKTNELTMRENEFISITANMKEGLVLINSRALVVSCNKSAKEIFGIIKSTPYNVMQISNSPSFRAAIAAALSGKNGYDKKKINERYYTLTVSPVFHNSGVEGAVILAIDETEKEAREALRREFTSNISHELKTPLTSISGYAELISEGMAEGEDAKRFASKIKDESKRLISLVGDIIRLSQLDGGEIPFDGDVDILSLAEDVKEHLQSVAEKHGVEMRVSGERLSVPANSTILFELIYNLVDNAIKYNKPQGRVEIKVYSEQSDTVLSVADCGIGIPKELEGRVFERFFRVDKSHSKDVGGTGLGLSIVKHSALYLGAKLELDSELGVGTEIRVRFSKALVE